MNYIRRVFDETESGQVTQLLQAIRAGEGSGVKNSQVVDHEPVVDCLDASVNSATPGKSGGEEMHSFQSLVN